MYVDDVLISLAHRPMTAKLVRCFFNATEQYLSKERLIKEVYQVDFDGLSPRMKHSLSQNLVKLVSRSRSFLRGASDLHGLQTKVDWFYFDRGLEKWTLYRENL